MDSCFEILVKKWMLHTQGLVHKQAAWQKRAQVHLLHVASCQFTLQIIGSSETEGHNKITV